MTKTSATATKVRQFDDFYSLANICLASSFTAVFFDLSIGELSLPFLTAWVVDDEDALPG